VVTAERTRHKMDTELPDYTRSAANDGPLRVGRGSSKTQNQPNGSDTEQRAEN